VRLDAWLNDPEVRRWWHALPAGACGDRFATLRRLGHPSETIFSPHHGRLADLAVQALTELDPLEAAVLTLRDLSGLDAERAADLLSLDPDELADRHESARVAWTSAVACRMARAQGLGDLALGPAEHLVLRHALVASLESDGPRAPARTPEPSRRRRDAERVVLDTPWETVIARLPEPRAPHAPPKEETLLDLDVDTLGSAYERLEHEHPALAAILLLRDVEALGWDALSERTGLPERDVRRVHAQARSVLGRLLEERA